jgi:hypothetical protein
VFMSKIYGVLLACLVPVFAACESIDRSSDCRQICRRFEECVAGGDFDVGRCAYRCEQTDSSFESSRIDDCAACIEDRSCSGSVFICSAECAGIVP